MTSFQFLSREDLRDALARDLEELERCAAAESWKAVHVLAGSLIEAVLADYLIATGIGESEVLKLTLGGLVSRCRDQGILTEKTVALSAAVKEYRNLIHPGRIVRLGERVDAQTGRVAQALVEIVAEEIALQKKATYGLTAEQLVQKLEVDVTAIGILSHLLADMKPQEVERLLLGALPARYLEIEANEGAQPVLRAFRKAFRHVFDSAPDDLKARVAKKYVRMLRTDPDYMIASYEQAFVEASQLAHLSKDDQDLVRSHCLSVLEAGVSDDTLRLLSGIGPFLDKDHVGRYLAPLVRAIASVRGERLSSAERHLDAEYSRMAKATQDAVMKQLDSWATRFRLTEREEEAKRLEDLKSYLDLPF